jgi:hypothetical protein
MPQLPNLAPESRRQISGTALIVAAMVAVAAVIALVGVLKGRDEPPDFAGWWRNLDASGRTQALEIIHKGDMFVITTPLADRPQRLAADVEGGMLVATAADGIVRECTLSGDGQELTLREFEIGDPSREVRINLVFERLNQDEAKKAKIAAAEQRRAAEQQRRARETGVKEGVHALQVGIQAWAVDHGDRYPRQAAVRADGAIASYVDTWPENPYTGEPMAPGKGPGDYTYTKVRGGFRLTGHVDRGRDYTVP